MHFSQPPVIYLIPAAAKAKKEPNPLTDKHASRPNLDTRSIIGKWRAQHEIFYAGWNSGKNQLHFINEGRLVRKLCVIRGAGIPKSL